MPAKTSKKNVAQDIVSAIDLMPKNKESLKILRERASYLALDEADKQEKKGFISYIKFQLGANEHYGIPYRYVKEVRQYITPTKIPLLPSYLAGIINHRGALLPIFDLKQIFHIPPFNSEISYIIVLNWGHLTVGLLADAIEGSDSYDPTMLDASLTTEELIKPEYLIGLTQGITAIINVEAVLSDLQKQLGK